MEPLPAPPPQGSTGYAAWQAEAAKRYPGEIEIKNSSPATDIYGRYEAWPSPPVATTSSKPLAHADFLRNGDPLLARAGADGLGGAASVAYDGTLAVVLRYHQNEIRTSDGSAPDPNDRPPENEMLYLKVSVSPSAFALDGDNPNTVGRDRSKEHVSIEVLPGSDTRANRIKVAQSEMFDNVAAGQGWGFSGTKEFYLKVEPKGALTVTVPVFKLFVKAWIDAGRATPAQSGARSPDPTWRMGHVNLSFGTSTGLTRYFAEISSGIEDSYRKVTDASQLPRVYRHSGNQDTYVIDDTQIGYGTKDGSGPGPWGVKVKRGVDGSMTVESAAEPHDQIWVGYPTFYANTPGFQNPSYEWVIPGVTTIPPGSSGSPPNTNPTDQQTLSFGGIGIDLGSGESGYLGQTNVRLTVTDTGGSNAQLTNSYTVNWHFPHDNWQSQGNSWKHRQPYPFVSGTQDKDHAIRNGELTASFRWDNYSYTAHALSEGTDAAFDVASSLAPNPIWATFIASAGMAKKEWFSPSYEQQTINFNDAWKDACTDPSLGSRFVGTSPPAGSAEDADQMMLYRMVNPQILVEYEFKPLKADDYNQHGFTGLFYQTARVYTGKATLAADFQYEGP